MTKEQILNAFDGAPDLDTEIKHNIVEQVNNRVENLCVGMNQEVDPITFKMNLRLFLEELEDEVLEHHRMLWEDEE